MNNVHYLRKGVGRVERLFNEATSLSESSQDKASYLRGLGLLRWEQDGQLANSLNMFPPNIYIKVADPSSTALTLSDHLLKLLNWQDGSRIGFSPGAEVLELERLDWTDPVPAPSIPLFGGRLWMPYLSPEAELRPWGVLLLKRNLMGAPSRPFETCAFAGDLADAHEPLELYAVST